MVCEHLQKLEQALIDAGAKETFRGAAWTKNCREWVYFDVILDTEALQARFDFPSCVGIHENTDNKSGLEKGFVCNTCNDAIMGRVSGDKIFR